MQSHQQCSSPACRYNKSSQLTDPLGCRGRSGGLPTQLLFAAVHTAMHLTAAVVLMVLLELGVETCIKCALWPCASAPLHCCTAAMAPDPPAPA